MMIYLTSLSCIGAARAVTFSNTSKNDCKSILRCPINDLKSSKG